MKFGLRRLSGKHLVAAAYTSHLIKWVRDQDKELSVGSSATTSGLLDDDIEAQIMAIPQENDAPNLMSVILRLINLG